MLGSDAKEDKCRQCRGDSSTCNTVTGLYDNDDLVVGELSTIYYEICNIFCNNLTFYCS